MVSGPEAAHTSNMRIDRDAATRRGLCVTRSTQHCDCVSRP